MKNNPMRPDQKVALNTLQTIQVKRVYSGLVGLGLLTKFLKEMRASDKTECFGSGFSITISDRWHIVYLETDLD